MATAADLALAAESLEVAPTWIASRPSLRLPWSHQASALAGSLVVCYFVLAWKYA
jgi:hypothetical protein